MKTLVLLLVAQLAYFGVAQAQSSITLETQHDLEDYCAVTSGSNSLHPYLTLNSMYVTDSTQRIHDLSCLSDRVDAFSLTISNTDITSLNDLTSMKDIAALELSENLLLSDLSKLNELNRLEILTIENLPLITKIKLDYDTLINPNLVVNNPDYWFINNPKLDSIDISFKFEVSSNKTIKLRIANNEKLKSLKLFSGGKRLHFDNLEIESNAKLEEVFIESKYDFTRLYSFSIINNPSLIHFYSTTTILGATASIPIIIENNVNLQNLCSIQESIRKIDSISPNNPHLVIQNNAPGANSVAEVLAANCDYLVNSVKEEAKVEPMLLYPNPAQTSFSILGANSQTPVLIYNSLGMLVQQTQGNEISIYNLPSGLYIVQWQNNLGAYQSQRLVKE